jgi:hypothetical protein
MTTAPVIEAMVVRATHRYMSLSVGVNAMAKRTSDAKAICDRLAGHVPGAKAGTLRFWGHWFGRPMDNVHRIVRCEADADTLRIWFDGGETLTVEAPVGFEVSADAFWIGDADRVRWEWFYYGRAQTPENLYYEEFVRAPEGVVATTNVDWYKPNLQPSAREKAVELL